MDYKIKRTLIKAVATGFVVIVLSFVGCSVHSKSRISKCITEGNDPILCRLALEDNGYTQDRFVMQIVKELQAERK